MRHNSQHITSWWSSFESKSTALRYCVLLSFPPSCFWYQTWSSPPATTLWSSSTWGTQISTDTDSQEREGNRLCKVGALYNFSAHALKFCHWSCSVISWSRPRFQERRRLLLVETKHSSSEQLSDWLAHLITFPFLNSYWSTLSWACAVPLQLIVLQSKSKLKLTFTVHSSSSSQYSLRIR